MSYLRMKKTRKVLIMVISIIAVNLFTGCKIDPWHAQIENNSTGRNHVIKKMPQSIGLVKKISKI